VTALFPNHVRLELSLFPFKVYMVLAPVALFFWRQATSGERVLGALAEAAQRILFGYLLCVFVFLLAAMTCFIIRWRDRVAENLIFAGISFIIFHLLAAVS
jgi:hypothetical protein